MSLSFWQRIENKVFRFVRDTQALREGEKVLVGLSGGPDSSALLLILIRLRRALGLEVAAAYFDHRLRPPEEIAEEMGYCQALCQQWDVPFWTGAGEVRAYARSHRLSLEEAGRLLRYQFLAQQAVSLGASVVAVGHTMTDQAETVLMHVLQGTGLDGLVAMRPRSFWPLGEGPQLARPLLCLRREETEAYCQAKGITPRRDPFNEVLAPLRNRIRRLLPLLEEVNPRVEEALARLAQAAAQAVDYMDSQAREAWEKLARVGPGEISFDRQSLLQLPPPIVSRLLVRGYRGLSPPGKWLTAYHLGQAMALAQQGRGRLDLPGPLLLEAGPQEVRLRLLHRFRSPLPETPLSIPGTTTVGDWKLIALLGPPPTDFTNVSPYEAYIDADAVTGPLLVTSRRPGDRMRPLGLGGEKKLQDILVDAKVPRELRDSIPVIRCSWGIVWVVGLCLDARASLSPGTCRAIYLQAVPPPSWPLTGAKSTTP